MFKKKEGIPRVELVRYIKQHSWQRPELEEFLESRKENDVVPWFDAFMLSHGVICFDKCVYSKRMRNDFFIYFLLYVDDMLNATKSKDKLDSFKTCFNIFKWKNSKSINTPLGAHFLVPMKRNMSKIPYFSVVGSLMYAIFHIRLDYVHVISVIRKFMSNFEKAQ
ncbi:hypothetical protein CR513_47004, partial [Mucuna pruriens]